MQVLHPTSGGLYTGITNAVSTIYRIEGWRTLWKGVSSVIVGAGMCIHETWWGGNGKWLNFLAGPAHAVYFGTYEAVKEFAGGNEDGHHPFAAGNFIS
jgi:solute carrier family 25 iron transporter 28/37